MHTDPEKMDSKLKAQLAILEEMGNQKDPKATDEEEKTQPT